VNSPRLTICIPTFDRLAFLEEAVASARIQTWSDLEILIADDGDSAKLRAWAEGIARQDARVRYLKTPERLRLAGAWNFLVRHARGEFCALIGDDDRLLPVFAERLLAASSPALAVVFSNHFLIDSAGRRLAAASAELTRHYRRAELQPGILPDARPVVWRNSVPMSSAIVRTSELRRLGFKPDINTPELEFFARLAGEGARFSFVPEYLAEYRIHAGSETARGLSLDRLAEYLELIPVPAELEPEKRRCLAAFVAAGVGIRLARADVDGARRLRASRYYPTHLWPAKPVLQALCLALPEPQVVPAYRTLQRGAHVLRGAAASLSRTAPESPADDPMHIDGWLDCAQLGSLLDVGCNVGALLAELRTRHPALKLAGVEVNPAALQSARQNVPGADLQQASAEDLPFADASFDCVTCIEVLEHVHEGARRQALAEMRRVLRPGGALLLQVPHAGRFAWLDPNNLRFRFPRTYTRLLGRGLREATPLRNGVVWHHHFKLPELERLLSGLFDIERLRYGGLVLLPLSDLARWPLYRLGRHESWPCRAFQSVAVRDLSRDPGPRGYAVRLLLRKL
jgi:SAM-dependent methyltransferase/GT2 family glycosyltransferase